MFVMRGPTLDFLDLVFLDGPPSIQVLTLVDESRDEVKIRLCCLVAEDELSGK